MGTFKEYWRQWLWRDSLSRLITINTLAWLLIAAVALVLDIAAGAGAQRMWTSLFAMPTWLTELASRPWTPVVYMFCDFDFLHVLVNMMWLLLFGRLLYMRSGGMRLAALYVYGGLFGAVATVAYGAATGQHTWLVGASAAVLSVATAITLQMPKARVQLFLFGGVQLVWIYLVCILFFVVLPGAGPQAAAHVGGIAAGAAYALLMPRVDITRPYAAAARWLQLLFSPRRAKGTRYKGAPGSAPHTRAEEAELDSLLAKVHSHGYPSLTAAERQRLFTLSRKIRI